MNDTPHDLPPPFGDDTDEALSALLDGELSAFADERQLSEDEVRSRLDAWPGAASRLDELGRVRMSVQAPVADLDDLARRRLVRTASEAASAPPKSRTARPWAKIIAVAAAGLIVVGGIGVAVSSTGGRSNDSSVESSAAGNGGSRPLTGDVGDLGDFTSASALRALLRDNGSHKVDRERAADSAKEPPSAPASGNADAASNTTSPLASAETIDPAACANDLVGTRDVIFSGTGTYQGAQAVIIGVDQDGRTIVFVVSSTDCTKVLASVSR